ncbi:hypothetical protein Hanom_Chr07g00677041 [Helianthus anomalus]
MKMTRFQTFWIQMRKNKPLDKSRKTSQTSETKMTFYSKICFLVSYIDIYIMFKLTLITCIYSCSLNLCKYFICRVIKEHLLVLLVVKPL